MKNALVKADEESTQELSVLQEKIVQYDAGFHRAYSHQMGHAFLAGVAINRAKEILPHGKFIPWIEVTKINRMSANRYARFAEALIKAHPAVGKCTTLVVHLTEGGGVASLSDDDQKQIVAAVHDVADGKTLTEFYRDLGVIRQPKKQEYHPKKLTPEEEDESARALAEDVGNRLAGDIRQLLHEWTEYEKEAGKRLPTMALWTAETRRAVDGVRIDLGKVLGKIKKGGKAKAKVVPARDPETLFSCPECGRANFTRRGLLAHRCKGGAK